MYENVTSELRDIIEPRLDIFYLTEMNFCFKSVTYKEIDDLDFAAFNSQKTIVFLLDNNFEDLKYTDNLRQLLSCSLVFTNKNLFKLFGIPERFFDFNAIVDEKEYFISNNSTRSISNENYVYEKSYSGADLNDIIKVTVSEIQITKENKDKLLADVLKFFCCGCDVYINSSDIKELLPENIKPFLNTNLSNEDKLNVQFEIHKNYSYIVQVNNIEQQLYGIFGRKYDLVTE